jgi:S1-C subfamily serine protease
VNLKKSKSILKADRMNIKNLLLSIVFIAVFLLSEVSAQTDKDGARSVVKITTSYVTTEKGKSVKKIGNASGWCWKDSKHIVTDLHVVAGIPDNDIKVYTDQEGKSSGAKVVKVLKEADLALLELDTDLGLRPLELQEADPNSGKEYTIWGFPHGIFAMAGDDIRFTRSLTSTPTLNSIINGNDLKFTLEKQGYPWPKAQILRISSTIQPGHSGAPIFTSTGKVVGIADGGLREGTARLNWAMPASQYVPLLFTSNDAKPATRSLQVSLYSSTTTVDLNATEEEVVDEMVKETKENTIQNGNQSILKTWTASYDEIIETMTDENKKDVTDIVAEHNLDMNDTWFDVYEDFETGATITIPYGENFVVRDGWYYVTNVDASLEFLTLPYNDESYASAKEGMNSVFKEILKSNTWVPDPETPDELDEDAEMETLSFDAMRVSNDGNNQILVYHAEIDGPDLLVVTLMMDGNKMDDPDYIKQVVHFGVAAELATFAKE